MSVKGNSVYDFIIQQIKMGDIVPGQTLTERAIANEIGVSRTPIREAFKKLIEQGLMEYEPHKGVKVTLYSKEKIEDLYEIRELLEGLSVGRIAESHTAEDIKLLENYIELAEKEAEQGSLIRLSEINSEFHNTLARLSGNHYLLEIMSDLQMQISLLMSQSLSNKGRPYENIQEHRMIINAIKTGDKSLAEETAKFHVRKSRDNILLKIKGD
ncbi:GntR family transcriptional regulator [Ureibacillus chungkukjangi]|uniref:GntR family transcriptional regulator n=1 Tax=Ureibacillus chungkukjangi TaxID=1202712 RepID=UPI00203FF7E1|nr:GntR family transcriptional regulator [Ureibacillus chungkukjangi]MCM3388212.1 GntR family transcriptional regulator [Ureibacillus chungkukjangi]